MKVIGYVGLGLVLPLLSFVVYALFRKPPRETIVFEAMEGAPALHRGEDACVWCGRHFPEPEFRDEYDAIYQEAMRPWVMQSYGDGSMPVMACCPEHMSLWYMVDPSINVGELWRRAL